MIKGLRIKALKDYKIMDRLAKLVKDQNNYKAREGALFAVRPSLAMLALLCR